MGKYTEQVRRAERRHQRLEQRIVEECRRTGHSRPVTRRDFLGAGLIGGVGTVFLPSIATMVAQEAHAQEAFVCDLGGGANLGAGKIPFIAIDQGGGANLAGSNFIVGKNNGQEDFLAADGYAKLGLPPAIIPQQRGVNREFGVAMHPDSALLLGMLSKTDPLTRANTNGVIIPARSENDTGNNPHNPCAGIAAAGAAGEFVVRIGTRNGTTGGRSDEPNSFANPAFNSVRVDDAQGARGLVGGDTGGFPEGDVAAAIGILSELKLGKITEAKATEDLVKCGYDKTTAALNTLITPDQLDPSLDVNLQGIFPNVQGTELEKAAAVMKVVIDGYGGSGTIEFGGRDYHGNDRDRTDGQDFVVGEAIGGALEYARLTNKPLMIYILSDGAVAADTNREQDNGMGVTKYRWRSDNSQGAASAILAFSPNGRPVPKSGIQAASEQIGFYRDSGDIETASSPFANSVTQLAEMVVLNYLALHGQEAMFPQVLPGAALGNNVPALAPYMAFNSIVA